MTSSALMERRSKASPRLFEKFEQDYEFLIATSDEDKKKVYSLRHEVFLRELHYEMHEDNSHLFELDEYDDTSIHCLINHRDSGLSAGCLRLITPSNHATSPLFRLPVEVHGAAYLHPPGIHPQAIPRSLICEVSRLAIARPFRSKSSQDAPLPQAGGYHFSPEEVKTFPLLAIGLFLSTYALVGLTGRRHVFAMMEPRLPRLLALSGFNFTKVSQPIEYHGTRHAYYIDHQQAEKEMHRDLMPLYLHITRALAPQLDAIMPATAITPIE